MKACNLWLSGVAGSCACVLAVTMHVLTLGVQCATHKAAFNLTVAGVHVQVMFGLGKSIAAQDPSYPVYVDTSVMMGNTGLHNGKGFDNIEYMVCTPENNFFPDLANVSAVHLERLLPAQHTSQHWGQFCVCSQDRVCLCALVTPCVDRSLPALQDAYPDSSFAQACPQVDHLYCKCRERPAGCCAGSLVRCAAVLPCCRPSALTSSSSAAPTTPLVLLPPATS